jgi:hypothetical protein
LLKLHQEALLRWIRAPYIEQHRLRKNTALAESLSTDCNNLGSRAKQLHLTKDGTTCKWKHSSATDLHLGITLPENVHIGVITATFFDQIPSLYVSSPAVLKQEVGGLAVTFTEHL